MIKQKVSTSYLCDSMRTSSLMSFVSKGLFAPLSRATGAPRAQNKKVGRISLAQRV